MVSTKFDYGATSPDEQYLKEKARDIYCRMPVVRISEIARRTGALQAQINAWRDAENWLELRANHQQTKMRNLLRKIGDPTKQPLKTIKQAGKLQKLCDAQLAYLEKRNDAESESVVKRIDKVTDIVAKVAAVARLSRQELGVDCKIK